ncbi:phosphate ABC transporter substrate-binding protein, PhoT family [Stanieria cyanosphaera PCC 7437]|uniref:Phosphate-binding protein n=1 Tax=Stanieria cyanosphaera (strain ATCC 29371 / PCC 7437) TaxID=111780 RepID=K9XR87_STAC7|nr:PstS family phosphate ABC transporter substrate-binding protein [Stanieria cyanosphaera]AFZ34561.1 phosphate ABC transporter substrate-binding protein, PhoT family [Stanieria cyanosphaera PCC 7437]
MNILNKIPLKVSQFIAFGVGTALVAVAIPLASQEKQSIKVDGSSTVYPITKKIIEEYQANQKQPVNIESNFSGTGGGFDKFCRGETDINNASRPIQLDEMEACNNSEVRYIELPVAFDALTVVVNPQNNWLESITLEELAKIWSPEAEGKITHWNQVRPDFPDQPLNLYSPGRDSGTFDYFTEAVIGEVGSSRNDLTASEDDDALVQGVSQDPNALGYFGLAYYEQRANEMKAIAVDSGKGAVLPSRETVEQAQYQPLSRPLFIYVNAASAQKNQTLREFIDFYLAQAPELVTQVGYVPLPEEAYHIDKVTFHKGEVGTVFEGKSQFNLTIPELLRKQARF